MTDSLAITCRFTYIAFQYFQEHNTLLEIIQKILNCERVIQIFEEAVSISTWSCGNKLLD
jgi:hypothetical protein